MRPRNPRPSASPLSEGLSNCAMVARFDDRWGSWPGHEKSRHPKVPAFRFGQPFRLTGSQRLSCVTLTAAHSSTP